MKTALFLILTTVTTAFGAGLYYPEPPIFAGMRRKPKIVGGEEAVPHSLPYQVGLFVGGSFCGGSLISKRYVLTAAHCAIDSKPVVVLGAHHINDPETEKVTVKGKKFIRHERFGSDGLDFDIAVIELPEEVELNDNIKLLKLTNPKAGLFVGATAQVSGWGLAYNDAPAISPVLRVVKSTIMSNDACTKKFGFRVSKTIICLDGSKLKGACNGDSGGPLVVETEDGTRQIGVVSYGSSAGCEKGYPTAYTRLTSYIDWVKKHSDYEQEE